MNKLKAFFGYFIAALMIPLAMAMMMSLSPLSKWIVDVTGIVISPIYTGGEVVQTINHDGYSTQLHRPVFDGLIGERKEGFVQVVWTPKATLPETLIETIDYNRDGAADFQVTLHSQIKTAEWQSFSEKALKLDGPYEIGDGMGVRVQLKK